MSDRMRVAVLFGGRSVEHEVSLRSAQTVIEALDRDRFEAIPVAVTREGAWRTGEAAQAILHGLVPEANSGDKIITPDPQRQGLAGPGAGGRWATLGVDVVFPLIHGMGGEDGTLQGLLDLADLPYVGSGVTASGLGMSKRLQRRLFQHAGLPVFETVEIHRADWQADPVAAQQRCVDGVGLPCFVKPSGSGSSVGVGRAQTVEDLAERLADAALYDEFILAEPSIEIRELECAVLGNRNPKATLPGEIIPQREFYDYQAKYLEDTTRLLIPAPLEEALGEEARRLAVDAFRCLDCAGLARVDFFLEKASGRLRINEVNTIPGFTSISMYPRLWAHEGIELPALVERLIDLALERHLEISKITRVLPGAKP